MKYQVLGPRVLLKVPKIAKHYPGSMIELPMNQIDQMTAQQTVGEIVQIGPDAFTNADFGLLDADLTIGDKVHFQRYGSTRLNSNNPDATEEFWVINCRDLLCIEVDDHE